MERLRPFVPHDPIEDVINDTNRHYSDPKAMEDQTVSNGNLPYPYQTTTTARKGETDFNEPEIVVTLGIATSTGRRSTTRLHHQLLVYSQPLFLKN